MQKHRFIQYLIIFILSTHLYSQPERWYQLYVDNNTSELENLIQAGQVNNPEWHAALKLLFREEIDKIFSQFIELYETTTDNLLKKIILDRVSQYYYAKGLYDTAERLLKEEHFRNQIFSLKKRSIQFGVQLGAFSSYNNALKSKSEFSGKINSLSIITKSTKGRKLYILVAGKFNSREDAELMKNRIFSNFKHEGMVIQY
jgi:hypothetical protein